MISIVDVPEKFRTTLLQSLQHESMRFRLSNIHFEEFTKRLQEGTVWIGVGDVWWFSFEHNGESFMIAGRKEKSELWNPPKSSRSTFSSPSPGSLEEKRSEYAQKIFSLKEQEKEWWFLFSSPLGIERENEHIRAYLDWLQALRRQSLALIAQEHARLYEALYSGSGSVPRDGTVYRLEDLPVVIREQIQRSLRNLLGTTTLDNSMELKLEQWKPCLMIGYWDPLAGPNTHGFIKLVLDLGYLISQDIK